MTPIRTSVSRGLLTIAGLIVHRPDPHAFDPDGNGIGCEGWSILG